MKEAVPPAAEGGRTALRAVYLDVLTSWNIFQAHGFLVLILVVFALVISLRAEIGGIPPPPLDLWNLGVSGKFPAKSAGQRS